MTVPGAMGVASSSASRAGHCRRKWCECHGDFRGVANRSVGFLFVIRTRTVAKAFRHFRPHVAQRWERLLQVGEDHFEHFLCGLLAKGAVSRSAT